MKRVALGALAICGLMAGEFSNAQSYTGEATLLTPVTTPSEFVIDAITWRCEGSECTGRSRRASKEPQIRECIKLVVAVGPVTAYRSRGRTLAAKALEECNAAAK